LTAALLCLTNQAARADDDVVVVKVKGEGIDRAGAVKDALRKAVEAGGKNEIMSKSQTQDFAITYDIVLARATGLVTDYKILSEKESGGTVRIEIEAKVSKKLIDATWGEVAILLKQMGRPKIMIIFTEIIHDLDRPEGSREIVQRDSILGTVIERKLLKLGFKLVNPGQMSEINRKKAEIAAMEDDVATLKQLAADHGAAIYIKGVSRASGPQHTTAAGVKLHMWETDVTIQGFWTETADAIFSNTQVGTRSGSRVAGPPGGRKALEKGGRRLAEQSVYDLLEAWSRGTMGQAGDIIVDVKDVTDIKQALAIKKALESIDGVDEVTRDGLKGSVKFTVATAMSAEEFLEHMVGLTYDGFELEFEDQKMKTIICKVKAG
jgi:hypothetical protein